MAFNHGSAQTLNLQHQQRPSESHATHLSLRRTDRFGNAHPLKQNPPSIAEDRFHDIDINDSILQPPPSALTAATAYDPHESSSPLEDYSPSPRTLHQRSLTGSVFDNCQPFLKRATSTIQQHTSRASLHSPTKSLASFIPSRSVIESTASQPKIKAGAKALQSWFNGTSAPVRVGIQSHSQEDYDSEDYDSEEEEEEMMINIFSRGPALTGENPTETAPKQPAPKPKAPSRSQTSTAGSRFAWLLSTQKNASVPHPQESPTYHNPADELLSLNTSQSLFPHGPVDPLAPESFNDLVTTAEHLLSRYQSAYRQLSSALGDARAEQSAQDDELDESETRTRHLKMQLETMAARANEQDAQMQKLMEELAFERRARQEEEVARKRSLVLIRGPAGYEHTPETPSPLSPRRRVRISNSDISVDSGFESECESEVASVFSRANCMSPTDTNPSSAASIAEENETTPKSKRPLPTRRQSTYEKVRDGSVDLQRGGWGCTNCEGGAQAAVWGRLAKEREESRILRHRVAVLEEAVDGALHVVDGY
ncbi:hypothetical protein K491DRAFT_691100 [Lophiostoma macrostomum CBS 122681]|uniref:Uncharacterized protein n=1 Tax=Lophiostoma macrostomum CBS 122681 TaxID=1314788 RepID=A0A6A6TFR4_9PLEO|nr:hypothetical protein K491DRAFT_691100 [Lophiostoma macrostomum CBS 122681]